MVTLFVAKALICFAGTCQPALIGDNTIPGEYTIQRRYVQSEGYGGDVLQYHEDEKIVYAIHRVWLGNPEQRRQERLESGSVDERRGVTKGCINVTPEVYQQLLDCCSNGRLIIKE
jgi:hypothetical protein